ncbi:2-amino-4-hydroxy-6-hydroxymethyldihydropteridine diphosphokinase [Lichenifustis flavocetrariae]|uniref:2-amino-4-hydroxy-6-hydroxymethyldihydropteridine pyrophosphokinase n=1 Tax=Lichenifustis flavocetrariae TaxID=2949735 RepID=A0AA41YTZ7_9HYPH|nr:2-amino-4-hydroxy-6-hydroxymethyldihydropteridine diphosphokinase [Lichenifustis flavocetrariae]MCW6508549.1 2-amino-4-hydroxy-6-hydroxymethyldihydropteridine diphosphokinase [Lichenifustis flavocetrariae]
MTGAPAEVGLSLGSNIGDKIGVIKQAFSLLESTGTVFDLMPSSLYRTAPWGHVVEQDWFVNACAVGRTRLAPHDLLSAVKSIETQLGRTTTVRWGPRVIDIDILYYGDLAMETPGLTLPHREILNRAFVLTPLAEIRPGHSIGSRTIAEAAATVGTAGVEIVEKVSRPRANTSEP